MADLGRDHRAARPAFILIVASMLPGCSAVPELPGALSGDWQPPVLVAVRALGPDSVAFAFSEPVHLSEIATDPALEPLGAEWSEERLVVRFVDPLLPGEEYWIDALVHDEAGNRASLLVSVWGPNPRLPRLLINEVVCEGSGNRPDWVELRALEAGNVGGATLYEGSPLEWDSRAIMPPIEVEADDLIVVHFKPERTEAEITEVEDRAASGGLLATITGWDVWVDGGDGIPNSTGALVLVDRPEGEVLDALLYSTRTADPLSDRRGFGTAAQMRMFEDVVAAGAWRIAGTRVTPADGFNPEESTATRSIARGTDAADTDTATDWHIVPTSGATPGLPNTDERHGE